MEQVLSFIESNHERYLSELKELLAIPSVSSQTERKPDMRRAAEWLKNHMTAIGLQNSQILETEGHPVVYADWLQAVGQPTILIYGHYDVQPEDPVDLWKSPPFEATERDGNLYARGTADDKGQIFGYLFIVGLDNNVIGTDLIESFVQSLNTGTTLVGTCLKHRCKWP